MDSKFLKYQKLVACGGIVVQTRKEAKVGGPWSGAQPRQKHETLSEKQTTNKTRDMDQVFAYSKP
jgi:hypothetical protein